MATVVDDFPAGSGRAPAYPYESWMDGNVWQLVRGDDFDITPQGMRASIHNYAQRNGIKVRTKIRDEILFLQYVGPIEDGEN